jgi:small subunit ribosomal protein S17e
VDRIKLLSMKVLKENKEKFGIDFDQNKNTLNDITTIRSKPLRNKLAGYITRFLKNEKIELEKAKNMEMQEQAEDQNELADLDTEPASKKTVTVERTKSHDDKASTKDAEVTD